MSTSTARAGYPSSRPAAPAPHTPAADTSMVRITVEVPLTGDCLSPRAVRLLQLVSELTRSIASADDDVPAATVLRHPAAGRTGARDDPSASIGRVPRQYGGTAPAPAPAGNRGPAGPAGSAGPVGVPGGGPEPPRLRVLTGSRVVLVGDTPVPLTRLEFDLLNYLAVNPRRVFSRRQLLSAVWRDDLVISRTVDVHIRRLRAKFGPGLPIVTTVRGVGYRLAEDARVIVHGDG